MIFSKGITDIRYWCQL